MRRCRHNNQLPTPYTLVKVGMRISSKKAKLIAVWLFVFSIGAVPVLSQPNTQGLKIYLTVNNATFHRSSKPVATITIENRTGSAIAMRDFEWFEVQLQSKSLRPAGGCGLDQCYAARLILRRDLIENGSSAAYNVNLSSLHWEDVVSSIRSGYPRNLFAALPIGEYNLHARLSVKAANWRSEDPRYRQIKSDFVAVAHIAKRK